MLGFGAFCFGLVIGWVTYRTLRRKTDGAALGDIAAVIGAVGGAIVTTRFNAPNLFATYSIGLTVGFFAYLIVAMNLEKQAKKSGNDNDIGNWMGRP